VNREQILRRRIKWLTWVFIIGLIVSGATAIPLTWELDRLAEWLGVSDKTTGDGLSGLAGWILRVREALHDNDARHPFMAYGTDWLAFGHFVIAAVFMGALRDPVRNRWLFTFGMLACAMVVPYALIMGGVRGIPPGWRLIDCSFGVFGFLPVWCCAKWAKELEGLGLKTDGAMG
jgi:hypothetical protein